MANGQALATSRATKRSHTQDRKTSSRSGALCRIAIGALQPGPPLRRQSVVEGRGDEQCEGMRRIAGIAEVERLAEVTLHHRVEQTQDRGAGMRAP